jgi:hypothetical protein
MPDVTRFTPATFSLYEFDDTGWAGPGGVAARRWFSHWDGLIGAPAEEVSLGWAGDGAAVVVATSGRSYDDADARYRAAHLALGGSELPVPRRPESPAAVGREMERIRDAQDLWVEVPGVLPGGPPAWAVACDGFAVGYSRFNDGVIFVAAVGVGPDRFRVREVRDWGAYDVDARTSFPLSALNR